MDPPVDAVHPFVRRVYWGLASTTEKLLARLRQDANDGPALESLRARVVAGLRALAAGKSVRTVLGAASEPEAHLIRLAIELAEAQAAALVSAVIGALGQAERVKCDDLAAAVPGAMHSHLISRKAAVDGCLYCQRYKNCYATEASTPPPL